MFSLNKPIHVLGIAALPGTPALPKPRGLINNGNTCYFNSVMQALAQTSILQTQLGPIAERGVMIIQLTRFYVSMSDSETSAFDPHRLQRVMFQRTGKFKVGMQHDSHECLLNILHELRKDERQGRAVQLTVVDKIFGGHCMTVYKCEECGTPSHLCEPFLDISLPISSRTARKSRKDSAKHSRSGVPYSPNRSSPSVYGMKRENPQQHEAYAAWEQNKQDSANRDIDFGNKDRQHSGRKRNRQSEDNSRDRSTGSKIQRREYGSQFTASQLRLQAAFSEPDPALERKEAYKTAVIRMMTTLSRGRESSNLHTLDVCTLDDCLRSYTRKEHIKDEYLCRECNLQSETEDQIMLTSATKQTLIYSPPAVLTIHLKRFENTSREYVKRSTAVQYGEVLDIGPYCSAWCRRTFPTSPNIWYSLYAVVVHSGTLEYGHYIAYVKVREYDQKSLQFLQQGYLNRDYITVETLIQEMYNRKSREDRPNTECPDKKEGTWYRMNDRAVKRVSTQEALNQEAFLLFYERF